MSSTETTTPIWNVFYRVDKITAQSNKISIEALDEDREALAGWLGLSELKKLAADVTVQRPHNNHLIYVRGVVRADVEQECVRSFKPVSTHIEEPFDAYFSETDKAISFEKGKKDLLVRHGHEEVPMLEEKEDPEPVIDGVINLGELATQFFVLSIPPYPRDESAELPSDVVVQYDDENRDVSGKKDIIEKYSPFQGLENWRDQVKLTDKDSNDEKN